MPIQTDFSDFNPSGTPQQAPTPTQADRDAGQMVDAWLSGNHEGAQQILDQVNGREFEGEPVPFAPVGTPAPAPEPAVANQYAEQLAAISDDGAALVRDWGTDFGENWGHAQAGLEKLRDLMPDLSDALDRSGAEFQNAIAAQLLAFAATYNRRLSASQGVRPLVVNAPAASASTRLPPSSPLVRSAAPSARASRPASLVPVHTDLSPAPDIQKLRTTPEIDRLSREAHRMWDKGLGYRDETKELFRQRDELISRLPGAMIRLSVAAAQAGCGCTNKQRSKSWATIRALEEAQGTAATLRKAVMLVSRRFSRFSARLRPVSFVMRPRWAALRSNKVGAIFQVRSASCARIKHRDAQQPRSG
jgi:hypothetical protein